MLMRNQVSEGSRIVFLSGANGFVGGAILKELKSNGFDVIPSGRKANPRLDKYVQTDMTSSDFVNKALTKVEKLDAFVHSAGLAHQFDGKFGENEFHVANVKATENALEFAIGADAKQFVLLSSVSVYGNKTSVCDEKSECNPNGYYAESKLLSEQKATEICEMVGLPLTILRLSTVFGEGDPGNILRLIRMIDSGRFLWIGKGENLKSLIYKNDVARTVKLVLDKNDSGTRVYNVSDDPVTMKQVVGEISKNLNRMILPIRIPESLLKPLIRLSLSKFADWHFAKSTAQTIDKWMSNDVFSADKIKRELGFQVKTPLSEGIKREVSYYLDNKRLSR